MHMAIILSAKRKRKMPEVSPNDYYPSALTSPSSHLLPIDNQHADSPSALESNSRPPKPTL
jgi:PIN domain nuclease of toxin-antitoxin system